MEEEDGAVGPKERKRSPKQQQKGHPIGLSRREQLQMTTVEREPFEFIKAEEGSLDADRNFNRKLFSPSLIDQPTASAVDRELCYFPTIKI